MKPAKTNAATRRYFARNRTLDLARELLTAHPFAEPSTFTHAQVSGIIQRLDRTDLEGTALGVKWDLEWLMWDRDGWTDRGGVHVKRNGNG